MAAIPSLAETAQRILENRSWRAIQTARINQAIAEETHRLGPNPLIIPFETPMETITTARHLVTGTTYAGIAAFRLQQHSKYFFNLVDGLRFPFPGFCFTNEPRTPVSMTGSSDITVLQTRNSIDIDDGRSTDFPCTFIPDLRRQLTQDLDSKGIRRELIEKSDQRSHYTILVFWTYSTSN